MFLLSFLVIPDKNIRLIEQEFLEITLRMFLTLFNSLALFLKMLVPV